jgi:hypothetical protein
MEFGNDPSVMYSNERDESTKLLVAVCGIDEVCDVISDEGNALVTNGEDATGAFRLKANFAFGIDAVRKSASATSSAFNCCMSIHRDSRLNIVENSNTDLFILPLIISWQRPCSIS